MASPSANSTSSRATRLMMTSTISSESDATASMTAAVMSTLVSPAPVACHLAALPSANTDGVTCNLNTEP